MLREGEGEPQPPIVRVPVQIGKVLELEGAFEPDFGNETSGIRASTFVYAHVSAPTHTKEGPVQYALVARGPSNGMAYLGTIDPETRDFTPFDKSKPAYYDRSEGNNVIETMSVPADQFEKLPKLDDLLAIKGLKVREELIPAANPTTK